MAIESRVYRPANLTVHEVYGGISRKEFSETLEDFYKNTGPTRDVLWDMRRVAWDMVSADEMVKVISAGLEIYRDHLGPRQGGRTAIVVSDDLGLGFATLGQMVIDASKPPMPFEVNVFRDLPAANYWLSEKRQH